jgi:hypothetical protein
MSYPAPSVAPLESFAPGAIIGNGTVSMFNATMSLFDARQWSTAVPHRAGDILEIRFSVEDWFAVTRQGRAARATSRPAVPRRPNDTMAPAFIELGGAISATQAAVRAVAGTVSMIVSLGASCAPSADPAEVSPLFSTLLSRIFLPQPRALSAAVLWAL